MTISWKDYLEHEKAHKEDPVKTQQFFEWIIKTFCPQLEEVKGSVLEIGIGTSGGYLKTLDNHQFDYSVSLDPLYGDIKEKAEDMPFDDNTFDLVIISNALSHCEDPAIVAKQIERVLKKNGILFLFNYYNEDKFHPHVYRNKEEILKLFTIKNILLKENPYHKGRNAFIVALFQK